MSNYTGISLEQLDREISKREDILRNSAKKIRYSHNSLSRSPPRNNKENCDLNRNVSKSHILPSPHTQKDSQYLNPNQIAESPNNMHVFQTRSMYLPPEQDNSHYTSNNLSNNLPHNSQIHHNFENESSYSNFDNNYGILYSLNNLDKNDSGAGAIFRNSPRNIRNQNKSRDHNIKNSTTTLTNELRGIFFQIIYLGNQNNNIVQNNNPVTFGAMPPHPYNNTPKNSNVENMPLFSFENNSIQKTGLNNVNHTQKNALSQALKELQTKNESLSNKILSQENHGKDQEKKEVRLHQFLLKRKIQKKIMKNFLRNMKSFKKTITK